MLYPVPQCISVLYGVIRKGSRPGRSVGLAGMEATSPSPHPLCARAQIVSGHEMWSSCRGLAGCLEWMPGLYRCSRGWMYGQSMGEAHVARGSFPPPPPAQLPGHDTPGTLDHGRRRFAVTLSRLAIVRVHAAALGA